MSLHRLPGVRVIDHVVTVPLVHDDGADPRTITVLARELVSATRAGDDLPLLLFLQGGPGGRSPRPLGSDGWWAAALDRFRVVLLDQRGTGRSTPVTAATMAALADGAGSDPAAQAAAQAEYLAHFRADAIVADAEAVRRQVYGGRRWTTLGQSYGGFLTLTYLSRHPEALDACLVTGGLASIHPDATALYTNTWARTLVKNDAMRRRHPGDAEILARVADVLDAGETRLPNGDVVSVRRLQSLGMDLGMQAGADRIHWLLDDAFLPDGAPGADERLSDTFLAGLESATGFRTNPLYAVLHESIYASGDGVTPWAAAATMPADFAPDARPLQLTGEMILPWMFEEIAELRPFRAATEALHARTSWPELYDRGRLAANEVPVVAAVYHDDMFVPADLSLATAAEVGNVRTWITNEHEHDGLRVGNALPHLLGMLDEGL
ncbi:alpha/beta hydrolase [Sanguibacter hominis ATCC BAA-789]|uniref:Alpha/beta hydrolase n=1 Tax=Sanguibacter hominis ATCC BAA-789 TaxID=1312740 RepID=A0A9X5FA77_9MICO|nr:alpha/beta fold hydrolase [Sanguibacter hominis]NKX92394.1 alpha/beta hydrolase [Sanguibacter hominis ATCC BAA-789]